MIHSKNGKKFLPILIFTLCFVMLLSSVFTFSAFAAEGEYAPVGETNSFKVAHVSDVHYFPNDLCPTSYTEDSTYARTIKEYFKLIPESGTMLNATCKKLLEQAETEKLDAIIISGDLTKDGEKRAHIDLANRLRLLQNEIRTKTNNKHFQIFVVLGNHDSYNSKTNHYLNNGEPTRIDTTTNEEFMHIYAGLGYPNFTSEEVDLYSVLKSDKSNQNEYDLFNTPFIKFQNSTLSEAYDYVYFRDSIKEYAADYAIELFNLKTGATLQEKEAILKKEPQAFKTYQNVAMQNVCSYVAIPNATKPELQGYTVAMIDSSLREPNSNARYGYEHITGGRIMDTTFSWLEDVLTFTEGGKKVPLAKRQETIVSSLHHGTVPHLSAQEGFMTDFLLYDWEESAVKLTDLGIRFTLTGHVHATDVASYIANNSKELTDIVTGSLISYGSPIRYMNFTRNLVSNGIVEKINDKTQTITSFKGVPMSMKDYPVLGKTIDQDAVLGKWFNDDASDGVAVNYIDDIQGYMHETVLKYFIPNLLEGYVNEGIVDKLTANFSKDQDLNVFIKEVITQLFEMQPKYLDKVYSDGVQGEKNLIQYLYTLVYDFMGHKETTENDFLETLKFPNLKTEKEDDYFTLGDLLINSYVKYLVNDEATSVESSDMLYSFKLLAEDGRLAKMLFGDPKDYNKEGKKSGLLYPLLYADNNLIDQVLDFKFDFSKSKMSESGLKVAKALFGVLDIQFDEETNYSFSLNQIIRTVVKAGKPFANEPGTVGTIFAGLNANGCDVTALLKDFVNSYAVDNFYINISGVLFDIIKSFGLDADKVGNPLNVTGGEGENVGLQSNGTIYETKTSVIPTSEYLLRGFTPSMLTLTFGKNAQNEMNLTWATAAFRNSTIKVDGVDAENIVLTKETVAYGYPLFDLGLFASFTNEHKYDQKQQIIKNGFAETTKLMNVYKVTIKGLQPGTQYKYTITTTNEDGSTLTNVADHTQVGTFTTALENGKFTFLGITDIQGTLQGSYEKAKENINNAITEITATGNNVDFIVNSGDVTDNGKNVKQWHYALNVTNSYNPTTNFATVFSKYPTVVAGGNHEKSDGVLARYFNIENGDPNVSVDSGLFYSFKYANAKFIVLNTNTATANGLPEEQYDWLLKELADNDGVDWKIVVMHKGLYTLGSHTNDVEVQGLRKQLTPVFYDNGVDLVLQGHDHTFTTTKFLDRNGKPVDNSSADIVQGANHYDTPNGVLYLTMGTIADKFYEFNDATNLPIDETHSIQNTLDRATYCFFTIEGKKLTINWRSFNETVNSVLKSNPMTIEKTRGKMNDATITDIILKVNGNDVKVDLTNPNKVYTVPNNFTFADMEVKRNNNSTWDIQVKVEEYGKIIYKSMSPTGKLGAMVGSKSMDLRLVVTSEDEKTTKYYPFKIRVNNIIEDRLGDLLKINGLAYKDELTIDMPNSTGHVTLALLSDKTAKITEDASLLEKKNVMKYFVEKDNVNYMVEIKGYNLGNGQNGVTIFISDENNNIIQYYVTVNTPAAPNTVLIVVIVLVVVILALVITNVILKKKKGKGLFSFMDKFKRPKKKLNID